MSWFRRRVPEPSPDPTAPDAPAEPSESPADERAATELGQPRSVSIGPEPAFEELEGALGPGALTPESPAPGAAAIEPGEPTLEAGVGRSRGGFMARLQGLLRGPLDEAGWEGIEETLIAGDVGGALALEVVARARRRATGEGAAAAVRAELLDLLLPAEAWTSARRQPGRPDVLLIVGVNGTGKTTTIAKLAHREQARGRRVLLAAADTFRAAAIEQLSAWADRLGVPVVAHRPGADPAAVVYDALDAGVARGVDLVIVDTAGRLHTKHNLMEELAKIRRTVDKRLPGLAADVFFVLDATTGQNGLAQARAFHEASPLTGIVLTKLDSTAKGGIVFAVEQALRVPVLFVGVGERLDDLVPFDPPAFVSALFA